MVRNGSGMKHELVIKVFDKWWQTVVEDEFYEIMTHNVNVLLSPAIIIQSEIVYDKSTKTLLANVSNTSEVQVEMEVWLLGNLPELDTSRRGFERLRKSYERTKGLDDIYKN